jgi:hypothetical protein
VAIERPPVIGLAVLDDGPAEPPKANPWDPAARPRLRQGDTLGRQAAPSKRKGDSPNAPRGAESQLDCVEPFQHEVLRPSCHDPRAEKANRIRHRRSGSVMNAPSRRVDPAATRRLDASDLMTSRVLVSVLRKPGSRNVSTPFLDHCRRPKPESHNGFLDERFERLVNQA